MQRVLELGISISWFYGFLALSVDVPKCKILSHKLFASRRAGQYCYHF